MTIGNWERLEDKQVPGGGETGSDKGGNAPNSPGGGQCKQKRNLTYTVTLNHAMAKSCTSFETQSLHRKSKPGKMYSIQAEVSIIYERMHIPACLKLFKPMNTPYEMHSIPIHLYMHKVKVYVPSIQRRIFAID